MFRAFRSTLVVALAVAGAAVAGCASSGLVNGWTVPGFGAPMKSLLVIAVKPNDAHRRIIEDGFVRELAKHGVTATASYGVFPALPDTQSVKEYVLANRLEGVLVVAKLADQERTKPVPPHPTAEHPYDTWTGRYYTDIVGAEHEDATLTQQIVPHRVDVWFSDHKGGQLVWTAESRSVDPSSVDQVTTQLVITVVPGLAKAHVIPPKR